MSTTEDRADRTTRRRLLRNTAAVVGTVGGVAAIAEPASAAAGDNLLQGVANIAGAATTTIQANVAATPTLKAGGLMLTPTAALPAAPPVGTMAVDELGHLRVAADNFAGSTAMGWALSSTWAAMTLPIDPMRILDTREIAAYDGYVVEGAGNIVGGRLQGGQAIKLSLVMPYYFNVDAFPPLAIQANITVANTAGGGYVTVWGEGERPGTSSLNFYGAGQILSNFVESPVQPWSTPGGAVNAGAINIYASKTTAVIIDLVAVVTQWPWLNTQ